MTNKIATNNQTFLTKCVLGKGFNVYSVGTHTGHTDLYCSLNTETDGYEIFSLLQTKCLSLKKRFVEIIIFGFCIKMLKRFLELTS